MKSFLRYWLAMLAMMAAMCVFILPVWALSALIDHYTDNLYLGFAVLMLFISLMVAAFQMWIFSPRSKRLVDRLTQAMFPTKREGT
jgi:hypothetical protein